MNGKAKNRWYDKNPRLSEYIDKLKNVSDEKREGAINGIKKLITENDENLIDANVMEFPLTEKRRWYDQDPYSWLVINALTYANDELVEKVIRYLHEQEKHW